MDKMKHTQYADFDDGDAMIDDDFEDSDIDIETEDNDILQSTEPPPG